MSLALTLHHQPTCTPGHVTLTLHHRHRRDNRTRELFTHCHRHRTTTSTTHTSWYQTCWSNQWLWSLENTCWPNQLESYLVVIPMSCSSVDEDNFFYDLFNSHFFICHIIYVMYLSSPFRQMCTRFFLLYNCHDD